MPLNFVPFLCNCVLRAGETPTALAISVVDVRCPAGRFWDVTLLHFLLDGHHKMTAASDLNRPINVLSLLWKDWPFTHPQFLEKVLELRYGETTSKS